MFKYLLFFSVAFYLTLLIGGQDNGQERMGLRGAYVIDLTQPAPMAAPISAPMAASSATTQDTPAPAQTAAADPAPNAPEDTLRVLPLAQTTATPAVLEQAAAPAEPAFNDFNNPTVILRTITAEAANVRDAASRNGAVIGRLERGEIVQMVEQVGDWVHIRIEGDGVEGFVHRRLISTEPPALSTYTLFPAAD